MTHSRLDVLTRCFKAVQLFQCQRYVTIDQFATALEVGKRSAYRYLDALSLMFPVYRVSAGKYAFLKGDE